MKSKTMWNTFFTEKKIVIGSLIYLLISTPAHSDCINIDRATQEQIFEIAVSEFVLGNHEIPYIDREGVKRKLNVSSPSTPSEFLEAYPHCCTIAKLSDAPWIPDEETRKRRGVHSVVQIVYPRKYVNQDGSIVDAITTVYSIVDNCGNIYNPHE